MSDKSPGPRCRVLLRSKQGVEVFPVPSSDTDSENISSTGTSDSREFLLEGETAGSIQTFAPDGSCVYLLLTGHGIVKCSLDTAEQQTVISSSSTEPFLKNSVSIQMMDISPKGTYLLTYERASEQQPNNLKVWCAKSGELLYGFAQKTLKYQGWPYLQWTPDEQYAMLMVTNEVRVYTGDDFLRLKGGEPEELRYIDKCRCAGIAGLSLPRTCNSSNSSLYLFTTFCPKTGKDKPARAALHEYKPSSETPTGSGTYPAILSKSLFQMDSVEVEWSPRGDAALLTLQTNVDTSGESYYGSASLYLLAKDAKDAIAVPLPQEGPVLDVQWMPNPNKPSCFVVIAGKMPAMASLHDGNTGEAIFLFGNAHRNTISWSSHGRFVCVAGFKNLAGNMSFWDRYKLKLIPPTGTNTSDSTIGYGWAPDSRTFGVSRTAPRRTVDNGFDLFKYNGEKINNVPWDNKNYLPNKLIQASFIPAQLNVYPDRPQSPQLRQKQENEAKDTPTASAGASLTSKVPGAGGGSGGGGRYVPPSARGRAGGTSLADRIRQEKEGNIQGAGKVKSKPGVTISAVTGKEIPGLVEADAAAAAKSKSALKRERAKASKQKKAEEEAKMQQQEAKKQQEAASTDPEKRARKLKKTLKQIDDLKARDPSSLNDDQKNKIASEKGILEELAKLGV